MPHRFLEEELSRRYREAAPATLALLQERCDAVSTELMAAEIRLKSAEDVGALRRAAMKYADTVARQVVSLLQGSAEPDPMQHGLTTDEERAASRAPQVRYLVFCTCSKARLMVRATSMSNLYGAKHDVRWVLWLCSGRAFREPPCSRCTTTASSLAGRRLSAAWRSSIWRLRTPASPRVSGIGTALGRNARVPCAVEVQCYPSAALST